MDSLQNKYLYILTVYVVIQLRQQESGTGLGNMVIPAIRDHFTLTVSHQASMGTFLPVDP